MCSQTGRDVSLRLTLSLPGPPEALQRGEGWICVIGRGGGVKAWYKHRAQTRCCHCATYFSLLFGWLLLPPGHQACPDPPRRVFAKVEPDVCHIAFFFYYLTLQTEAGGRISCGFLIIKQLVLVPTICFVCCKNACWTAATGKSKSFAPQPNSWPSFAFPTMFETCWLVLSDDHGSLFDSEFPSLCWLRGYVTGRPSHQPLTRGLLHLKGHV